MLQLTRTLVVGLLALSLIIPATASAATTVVVPEGTKVPLKFLTALDSRTVKQGTKINFRVAADVVVQRRVVIRSGAAASGVVDKVAQPGSFGRNAMIHISFLKTVGVDGRAIALKPIAITPESLRQVKDTSGAVATSAGGLILLGPIGIAAGALVRGGHVSIPAGAVGVGLTASTIRVRAR